MYTPVGAEVLVLAVLRRCDDQPPTYELVQRVFAELAGHRSGCSCWRCQAAAKVDPDRVWKCLQAWRRTYEQ